MSALTVTLTDGRVMPALKILHGYAWVERIMVEDSPTGIIHIPEMARPTVFAGNILALPDGVRTDLRVGDGVLFTRKGNRPIYGPWAGTLRIPLSNIVATIERDGPGGVKDARSQAQRGQRPREKSGV